MNYLCSIKWRNWIISDDNVSKDQRGCNRRKRKKESKKNIIHYDSGGTVQEGHVPPAAVPWLNVHQSARRNKKNKIK